MPMPSMMTGRRPMRSARMPNGQISIRLMISVTSVSWPVILPARLGSAIPRCSIRMYGWEKFMFEIIPIQIRDAYM